MTLASWAGLYLTPFGARWVKVPAGLNVVITGLPVRLARHLNTFDYVMLSIRGSTPALGGGTAFRGRKGAGAEPTLGTETRNAHPRSNQNTDRIIVSLPFQTESAKKHPHEGVTRRPVCVEQHGLVGGQC